MSLFAVRSEARLSMEAAVAFHALLRALGAVDPVRCPVTHQRLCDALLSLGPVVRRPGDDGGDEVPF